MLQVALRIMMQESEKQPGMTVFIHATSNQCTCGSLSADVAIWKILLLVSGQPLTAVWKSTADMFPFSVVDIIRSGGSEKTPWPSCLPQGRSQEFCSGGASH